MQAYTSDHADGNIFLILLQLPEGGLKLSPGDVLVRVCGYYVQDFTAVVVISLILVKV